MTSLAELLSESNISRLVLPSIAPANHTSRKFHPNSVDKDARFTCERCTSDLDPVTMVNYTPSPTRRRPYVRLAHLILFLSVAIAFLYFLGIPLIVKSAWYGDKYSIGTFDSNFHDLTTNMRALFVYCLGLSASVWAQSSAVDAYVASESPIAKAGVLANIGPSGSKSAGAKVDTGSVASRDDAY